MNAENSDEDHVKHAAKLVPKVLGAAIRCYDVRKEVEQEAHFVEHKYGFLKVLDVLGPRH